MSAKSNRPADGCSADHSPVSFAIQATTLVDHVEAFVAAWAGKAPSAVERGKAIRVLLDMLIASRSTFERLIADERESAMGPRERKLMQIVLGDALHLGVLCDDDLDWAANRVGSPVTLRPVHKSQSRLQSQTFRPMGLRGLLLADNAKEVVVLVKLPPSAPGLSSGMRSYEEREFLRAERSQWDVEVPS